MDIDLVRQSGALGCIQFAVATALRPRARSFYAVFFSLAVVCAGCAPFAQTPIDPRSQQPLSAVPPAQPRHFEHVLIIVLENQDYDAVIKDPYFATLAQKGASFTDFHGLFHPSYSNYLAMVAGREIPSFLDIQRDLPYETLTIADLLESAKLTWKNYAEGYPRDPTQNPQACFTESSYKRYVRRHVPFLSFVRVQLRECYNIVPAELQFDKDLKAFPNYAFYTPDLDNDGHDPQSSPTEGLAKAAAFLKQFLDLLLDGHRLPKDTLIVVTFDESHDQTYKYKNHIYTVFLGDMVQPTADGYGGNYNHYNVLRTIEENFGLVPLADGDGKAKPITEVWK